MKVLSKLMGSRHEVQLREPEAMRTLGWRPSLGTDMITVEHPLEVVLLSCLPILLFFHSDTEYSKSKQL